MHNKQEIDSSLSKRLLFLLVMLVFLITPFGVGSILFGAIAHTIYLYEQSFAESTVGISGNIREFDQKKECYYDANRDRQCTYYYIVRFEYTDPQKGKVQDSRTVYYNLWKSLQENPESLLLEYNTKIEHPQILTYVFDLFDIDLEEPILRVKGENEMFVVYFTGGVSFILGIFVLWMILYTLRGTLDEDYYRKKMIEQREDGY